MGQVTWESSLKAQVVASASTALRLILDPSLRYLCHALFLASYFATFLASLIRDIVVTMPSVDREESSERELVLKHQPSFSDSGRASVPMCAKSLLLSSLGIC